MDSEEVHCGLTLQNVVKKLEAEERMSRMKDTGTSPAVLASYGSQVIHLHNTTVSPHFSYQYIAGQQPAFVPQPNQTIVQGVVAPSSVVFGQQPAPMMIRQIKSPVAKARRTRSPESPGEIPKNQRPRIIGWKRAADGSDVPVPWSKQAKMPGAGSTGEAVNNQGNQEKEPILIKQEDGSGHINVFVNE